jgi:hypothetical protein
VARLKQAHGQRICHARTHKEMVGIMPLNSSNPRKIKSRPRKSDDGNMEHAETLGGKSTFQATSAYYPLIWRIESFHTSG